MAIHTHAHNKKQGYNNLHIIKDSGYLGVGGGYAIEWEHTGSSWGTGEGPFLGVHGGLKAVHSFCCLNYTYIFSHAACILYGVSNDKNKL